MNFSVHAPPEYLNASSRTLDDKIYFAAQDGKIYVVDAGSDWSVAATNDLGEEISASPAISEGRLLIRTDKRLYGFGG